MEQLQDAHERPGNAAPPASAIAGAAFDEAILERLVALNAERAAEEARGLVRWLHSEFQNPSAATIPEWAAIDTERDETNEAQTSTLQPSRCRGPRTRSIRCARSLMC